MRDYVMVDGRLHVRTASGSSALASWTDRLPALWDALCDEYLVEPVPEDGTEPRWVPRASVRDATLTEVLTGLGYTSLPDHDGPVSSARRTILRDGEVVFSGRAWAVWEWLREGQPDKRVLVQRLREHTGASVSSCRSALEQTDYDFDAATDLVMRQGQAGHGEGK